MKKILTTLAVAGLSIAAYAQGYVNWTGAAASVYGQTNGASYSGFVSSSGAAAANGSVGFTLPNTAANNTSLGYSGYYYELLTSASASSSPTTLAGFSAWSDTGLGATNSFSTAAGRIIQANGSADSAVNNWPVGNTQAIILVGWSANLGSSWSTVLNELNNWSTQGTSFIGANAAYFGVSAFGSGVQAVASSVTGNQVIGAGAGEIYNPSTSPLVLNQLAVATVPEPATMALAALGGASLLLFRRKK